MAQEAVTVPEKLFPLLESKNFQFTAQQMQPTGGRSRILNTLYFVRVTPEKLSVDLPYIGRAYSIAGNPGDNPFRFDADQYDYAITDRPKDGKQVTIQPKTGDIRQLVFTIFGNGSTTLNVISNSRQAISYTGYIETIPVPKTTHQQP